MPSRIIALGFVLLLAAACAQPTDFRVLSPNDYQSFVANWTPQERPFCAAFESGSDWTAVMHPAPTQMSRSFAPPDEFWRAHAVLLLARVVNSGDASHVFRVNRVERGLHAIDVDYTFTPTPAATSTMKWYLAIEVAKPLPRTIRFREAGQVTCEISAPSAHSDGE